MVEKFDYSVIEHTLRDVVSSVARDTWEDSIEPLAKAFQWEYETPVGAVADDRLMEGHRRRRLESDNYVELSNYSIDGLDINEFSQRDDSFCVSVEFSAKTSRDGVSRQFSVQVGSPDWIGHEMTGRSSMFIRSILTVRRFEPALIRIRLDEIASLIYGDPTEEMFQRLARRFDPVANSE